MMRPGANTLSTSSTARVGRAVAIARAVFTIFAAPSGLPAPLDGVRGNERQKAGQFDSPARVIKSVFWTFDGLLR